jgi:hypothetical protein
MKITRLYNEDWEAYYDELGRLLLEGHSVDTMQLLKLLGFQTENKEHNSEDFPANLGERVGSRYNYFCAQRQHGFPVCLKQCETCEKMIQ